MRKKKVYISLPITGQDFDEVETRILFTCAILEKFGFEPVSPLDVSNNPEASYEEHIGNGITALLQCDAVIFLKGWTGSKGCNLEHEAARIYGKMIFHSMKEVEKYSVEQCIKEQ